MQDKEIKVEMKGDSATIGEIQKEIERHPGSEVEETGEVQDFGGEAHDAIWLAATLGPAAFASVVAIVKALINRRRKGELTGFEIKIGGATFAVDKGDSDDLMKFAHEVEKDHKMDKAT